jgi:DNA-binding transcriptional ArsR family regulator
MGVPSSSLQRELRDLAEAGIMKKRRQGRMSYCQIAKAAGLNDGCVVSSERFKENAAKVPNVRDDFGVEHMDLETFMERENWTF